MQRIFVSLPLDPEKQAEYEVKVDKYRADFETDGSELVVVDNTKFMRDMAATTAEKKEAEMDYLAMSITAMKNCDAVLFFEDWESYNICKVESLVAQCYRLEVLDEAFLF